MYRVLQPVYVKTGEVVETEHGPKPIYRLASWTELGAAKDMREALKKFPRGRRYGYSHILEEIQLH